MSTTPTAHYDWGKPANDGDSDTWGLELNTAIDAIDAQVFAIDQAIYGLVDTGVANAYVVAPEKAWTALNEWRPIVIIPANTNTGASTIVISALAAAPLVRSDGTPLQAGDLVAGQPYDAICDGTNVRILRRGIASNATTAAGAEAFSALTSAGLASLFSGIGLPFSMRIPGLGWLMIGVSPTIAASGGTAVIAVPQTLTSLVSAAFITRQTTASGSQAADCAYGYTSTGFTILNNGNTASSFAWLAIGN